jgi:hypothetical protein
VCPLIYIHLQDVPRNTKEFTLQEHKVMNVLGQTARIHGSDVLWPLLYLPLCSNHQILSLRLIHVATTTSTRSDSCRMAFFSVYRLSCTSLSPLMGQSLTPYDLCRHHESAASCTFSYPTCIHRMQDCHLIFPLSTRTNLHLRDNPLRCLYKPETNTESV